MEPVDAFLNVCRLARKQTHRNLTVFALPGEKVFDPDYLLLETALAEGLVEIRELGPEGSVPELRLVNRAERPVLVVEGEELVGAKQNRAVNVTILVAAGAELVIPVSCVEQGRWHYRSEKFSSGARMMHSSLRREAREGVRFSMSRGAGYRGDQGRVWDAVAETASRLRVDSPTMAADEVFERYEDRVVHLSAFRKTGQQKPGGRVGFQRYSRRRQRPKCGLRHSGRHRGQVRHSRHLRLDGSRTLHRARRQLAFQAFHLLVAGTPRA